MRTLEDENMKKQMTMVLMSMIFTLLCVNYAEAVMKEIDVFNSSSPSTITGPTMDEAQFVFANLRYEPYPVNAGEWFDVWIKVQNVGRGDATNATFTLIPSYPFDAPEQSLTQNLGLLPGIASEIKYRKPGESIGNARQVVLKYRLKTANNAAEGVQNLNFLASPYSTIKQQTIYSIPIEIAKTKTDFAITLQDVSDQGVSFAIANIGGNPATAVTLSLEPKEGVTVKGASSTIIGNLDTGDFTTVTFQITQSAQGRNFTQERNFIQSRSPINEILMTISYTDTAAIRNTLEKNVSVDLVTANQTAIFRARATASQNISIFSKYATWIYGVIGLMSGIIITSYIYSRKM